MTIRCATFAFLCCAAAALAGDTLIVEPAEPTVRDSITFRLFNFDACCCGVYHDTAVFVADTVITLSFTLDAEPCTRCECFAPGSWIAFKTGPLAAGTYGVYKVQAPYCPPGEFCAQGPIVLIHVRVGEITVRDTPVSARRAPGLAAAQSAPSAGYHPSSETVRFNLPCAQHAVVSMLSADGRRTTLAQGHFSAGAHTVGMTARDMPPGAFVLRVDAEQFSWSGTVLHVR